MQSRSVRPNAAALEEARKFSEENNARKRAEADAILAAKKAELEAAARRQLEEEMAAMKFMVRNRIHVSVPTVFLFESLPHNFDWWCCFQWENDRQAKVAAEAAAHEARMASQDAVVARTAAETKAAAVKAAGIAEVEMAKSAAKAEEMLARQRVEAEAAAQLAAVCAGLLLHGVSLVLFSYDIIVVRRTRRLQQRKRRQNVFVMKQKRFVAMQRLKQIDWNVRNKRSSLKSTSAKLSDLLLNLRKTDSFENRFGDFSASCEQGLMRCD